MNINDEKMIQIQNKINGKASLENELKDLQNNKIKLGNDLIELRILKYRDKKNIIL